MVSAYDWSKQTPTDQDGLRAGGYAVFSAAAHLKQRGLGGGADCFSRATPPWKGCARALVGGCFRGGVLTDGEGGRLARRS